MEISEDQMYLEIVFLNPMVVGMGLWVMDICQYIYFTGWFSFDPVTCTCMCAIIIFGGPRENKNKLIITLNALLKNNKKKSNL